MKIRFAISSHGVAVTQYKATTKSNLSDELFFSAHTCLVSCTLPPIW